MQLLQNQEKTEYFSVSINFVHLIFTPVNEPPQRQPLETLDFFSDHLHIFDSATSTHLP